MRTYLFAIATLMITVTTYTSAFANRPESWMPDKTYINKTGTVRSIKQDVTTFRATTEWVTIQITKTDGRAQTIVQIYADNKLQKTLEFKAGTQKPSMSYSITDARSKNIKIVMINKSVANTFKYRLKGTGKNPCKQNETTGTIPGGESKTFSYSPQCSDLIVRISRTGGRAAGEAKIWSRGQLVKTLHFPRGVVPDTKSYRLEDVDDSLVVVVIKNLADPSKELRYKCEINGTSGQ